MARYPLIFVAAGIAIPFALPTIEPAPGYEPLSDPLYYTTIALWPSLLPTYLWCPVEWIREHPYGLFALAIISNAFVYGLVGSWLYGAREHHPALRFGLPLLAWALLVVGPWASLPHFWASPPPPNKALQLTGYRSFQLTSGTFWHGTSGTPSTRGGGPAAERLVR